MEDFIGFRLCPTEDETVGCHLYCKLMGEALQANEFINEIGIYNFDPWELRFKSKLKSRDPVWYFFVPVENNYANGDRQKRTTNSGFWKITGDPLTIFDRWGRWSGNRGPIGYKRVLRFHMGKTPNVGKADWVMHEYHNTMVLPNQRTHVICRVEYKGDNTNFISDNATELCPAFAHHLTNTAGFVEDQLVPGNTLSAANQMGQSVQGNCVSSGHLSEYNPTNQIQQHLSGNLNTQEQVHFTSNNNEIPILADKDIEEMFQFLFNNEEPNSYTYMQENYNEYRPKDPVTRVFDDYSSDNDNESTLFGDTSSSEDSVGNPNELCSVSIPPLNSIETEEVKMELQGKEKVISEFECKMAEDFCVKKTPVKNRCKQSLSAVDEKIEKIEKKSQKTRKWIYLRTRTVIIAVFLLLSIIAWTTLLH